MSIDDQALYRAKTKNRRFFAELRDLYVDPNDFIVEITYTICQKLGYYYLDIHIGPCPEKIQNQVNDLYDRFFVSTPLASIRHKPEKDL